MAVQEQGSVFGRGERNSWHPRPRIPVWEAEKTNKSCASMGCLWKTNAEIEKLGRNASREGGEARENLVQRIYEFPTP